MAVLGVDVYQARENQSCRRVGHFSQNVVHALTVVCGVDRATDATTSKKIVDLAHRHDRAIRHDDTVEQRFTGGSSGEIAPIRCASEMRRLANEWPRDHAADA